MGWVGRQITAYAMLRGTATPFSRGAVPPYIPRHNARGSHLPTFSPTLPTLPFCTLAAESLVPEPLTLLACGGTASGSLHGQSYLSHCWCKVPKKLKGEG